MPSKVVVPAAISSVMRTFGLPREVAVQMCNRIHVDIPADYEKYRNFRSVAS
jgi:hypothetical protein